MCSYLERSMPTIAKGDRPMTVINVFTVAIPREALTIARFDPGFYEVVEVFTPDASPPAAATPLGAGLRR
jgi:hypothetical protein